jgi:sterol desaturase/sphingolipid hydroxylase (fatty acid hydroxylase superfamily)
MLQVYSIVAIAAFVIALTIFETYRPSQSMPPREKWWLRVGILQAMVLFIVTIGVSSWQEQLVRLRLVDGTQYFTPFWGGVFTYVVGTFVFYFWHVLRHRSNFFWRVFHQIHHSPSRIQAVTAFYVHPIEAVVSSLINAVIVFVIFGLTKESLIWNADFMAVAGIFYHANIRTPHWLGYVIQRPEMHRQHHEFDVHGFNYADLPVWDIAFGTYRNPKSFTGRYGFEGDREMKLGQLLLGHDLNAAVQKQDQSLGR